MEFELQKGDVSGFGLTGWRLPDGTIELCSGRVIEDWPSHITLLGNTYTLEDYEVWGVHPDPSVDKVCITASYV